MRALTTLFLLGASFSSSAQVDLVSVLKEAAMRYYSVPDRADKLDWADEAKVKNKLLVEFKSVLTEPALSRFAKWIEETSTRSSFYDFDFESMRPVGKVTFGAFRKDHNNGYTVLVRRTMRQSFWEAENLSSIKGFVEKYKISNYTQTDIEKHQAQSALPELIVYIVDSEIEEEFQFKPVRSNWLISDIQLKTLISSKLKIEDPTTKK